MRLLIGQRTDQVLDHRHPGGATNQNHLVDLPRFQPGIAQGGVERFAEPLNQVFGQLLELGAREFNLQVLGSGSVGRDVWQVDLGFHH